MKIAEIPKAPTRLNELRRWVQGYELDQWANDNQEKLMADSAKSLEINREALLSIESDQRKLTALKREHFLPDDELNAEEMRLAILREKAIGSLDKLVSIHARLTNLSNAVIVAALTQPGKITGPDNGEADPMRDVNPRRSLAEIRKAKVIDTIELL